MGARRASPATSGRRVNSPSSGPRRRWSRARASSKRSRCASSSGLREERGPVDPGQHLPGLVAAPVRPRHRAQLERLDPPGRGTVRAAAQVQEGAVPVQRDRLHPLIALQVLDQLDLVRLVLGAEALDRLVGAGLGSLERLVGLDVRRHPLLDSLQVVLRRANAVRELEVVIEAVLDRGADRDLGAGPEVEHRGRHHVRRVVSKQPQRLGLGARGDDLDLGAVGERRGEVAQLTVDLDGERVAGQPRPDRGGRVGAGRALVQLERRPVGELHRHRRPCYSGTDRTDPTYAPMRCTTGIASQIGPASIAAGIRSAADRDQRARAVARRGRVGRPKRVGAGSELEAQAGIRTGVGTLNDHVRRRRPAPALATAPRARRRRPGPRGAPRRRSRGRARRRARAPARGPASRPLRARPRSSVSARRVGRRADRPVGERQQRCTPRRRGGRQSPGPGAGAAPSAPTRPTAPSR